MPRKDVMEWLGVTAAGCVVVVMLVGAAAFGLFPFQQRIKLSAAIERLDKIESQLAANEERLRSAGLIPRALAALDRRVSDLDTRVRYPRSRALRRLPAVQGRCPQRRRRAAVAVRGGL